MTLFRATTSFSGAVAGAPGQIVEINEKAVEKDLLKAGYIVKLSKEEADAEQKRRDEQSEREAAAEEARQEAADSEPVAPRESGLSAAETQQALNDELKPAKTSKSASKETNSPAEAKAAYQGAETNQQDAAANPKPTVNAAKSGQTSQGGVDVTPAKDPHSTKGTTQGEDDPAATITDEQAEANQAAVKAQAAADKAAAEAAANEAEHGPVNPGASVTLPPESRGEAGATPAAEPAADAVTTAPAQTKNTTPSSQQKAADQAKAKTAAKTVTRPSTKK